MQPRSDQQGPNQGGAPGRGPDTGEFPGFGKRGDTGQAGVPDPWGGPRGGEPAGVSGVTGPAGAPPGPPAPPKVRTGLVLLVALLVELVVIAGVGNQWVSDKLVRQLNGSSVTERALINLGLVFSWRFSPRGGSDRGHIYLSQMVGLGAAVVLSLLLILILVRGTIGFGRAFVSIWVSVAVAAMLGGYVRGLLIDLNFGSSDQGNRVVRALFGITAPGSVVFLAGAALGLIVAIIAGIVAVATRRSPAAPWALAPMGAGGPAGAPVDERDADTGDRAPWQDRRYGPPNRERSDERADRHDSRRDEDEERTTALPAAVAGGAAGGAAAAGALRHDGDRARDRDGERDGDGDRDGGRSGDRDSGTQRDAGPAGPWAAPQRDDTTRADSPRDDATRADAPRDEPAAARSTDGGHTPDDQRTAALPPHDDPASASGGASGGASGAPAAGAAGTDASPSRDAGERPPTQWSGRQGPQQPADQPPVQQGEHPTAQQPPVQQGEHPIAQQPPVQQAEHPTAQQPPVQQPGQQPTAQAGEHPTTQFPRPPDDEDFGDIEPEHR